MNALDFTQLILISSAWFLAGIIIYYLLSFIKVHLILHTQSRVFNSRNGEKLFSKYFITLLKSLFSFSHLHKNTLNYIFNYKEDKFKVFPDEKVQPIKKRLGILESLTLFLKPFLFFALVFSLLRLWIQSEFLYNGLSITLGEVQKLLNSLNNFYAVKILSQYKYLIYLIFGLVTIFIPYIYNKDTLRKKLQQNLKYIVISISIITNVTFFGTLTGNNITSRNEQLTKLELEIESIHSNIYKEASIGIILSEVKNELKEEEEAYNQEFERFKSEINKKKYTVKNPDINKELSLKLLNKLKEIQLSIFEINRFNFYDDNTRKKKQHYSEHKKYYSNNYTQNSTYKEYEDYMGNKEKWNKKKGKSILEQVEKITKANERNNYSKKLADCLGAIFDYGLNEITSGLFNELDISSQKVLKKITSIWSKETFKKGVINKVINFLNDFPNTKKVEAILQSNNGLYSYNEEFEKFKLENNSFLKKEIKVAKKKQFKIDEKIRIDRNLILLENKKAEKYLKDILENNKWEIIRINFYNDLITNQFPLLNLENRNLNINAYKRWQKYLNRNKVKFYSNSVKDIEPYFLTFIKQDPELLITWAYTLLAREPSLGRLAPVDALNYYFNQNGESYESFKPSRDFYKRMEKANNKLCGKK